MKHRIYLLGAALLIAGCTADNATHESSDTPSAPAVAELEMGQQFQTEQRSVTLTAMTRSFGGANFWADFGVEARANGARCLGLGDVYVLIDGQRTDVEAVDSDSCTTLNSGENGISYLGFPVRVPTTDVLKYIVLAPDGGAPVARWRFFTGDLASP